MYKLVQINVDKTIEYINTEFIVIPKDYTAREIKDSVDDYLANIDIMEFGEVCDSSDYEIINDLNELEYYHDKDEVYHNGILPHEQIHKYRDMYYTFTVAAFKEFMKQYESEQTVIDKNQMELL